MSLNISRPEMYDAIEKNDIKNVTFKDPFQDEARKAKRNLVVSSFIAILVASLGLHISSFLGLQATAGALEPAIVKGLACLVVTYSLVSFVFAAYIDYSAWKFEHERLLIEPYVGLISMVESNFDVLHEQFHNTIGNLDGIRIEPGMQGEIELAKTINDARSHLRSLTEEVVHMNAEIKQPLTHWKATIMQVARLSWRLRARHTSLWILDILFPLAFGSLALWKTVDGLRPLLAKLL